MHDNVVRERETVSSELPVLRAHKQTGAQVRRIGEPGGHDTAASSGFSRADHEIPTTIGARGGLMHLTAFRRESLAFSGWRVRC
jgi:hypothetical protein